MSETETEGERLKQSGKYRDSDGQTETACDRVRESEVDRDSKRNRQREEETK